MAFVFDGPNKRINLTSGTTTLDIRDIWSQWVNWLQLSDNSKFAQAFKQVGGDSIDAVAGTSIPIYCFLLNGWKIKPQEADHTLNVSGGILLVEGGGDPFISTNGDFAVRINYQQPVQAIGFSTSGTPSSTGGIKKGLAFDNFTFVMNSRTTNEPISGETIIAEVSLDGDSFTQFIGTITEVSNGVYKTSLSETYTSHNTITLRLTSSNSSTRLITIIPS